MKFNTKCIHSGYTAKSGEPQVLPISQNTTYRYYDSEDVAKLFDLDSADYMYSRLGNPTVNALEEKMAAMEGGTAGIATSSGMAATLITALNICEKGDHIISSTSVYGGTFNLFDVTLRKLGINTTFVDPNASLDDIIAASEDNTKLIFAETLANPALTVLDFDKFSKAAKKIGVPLVVDNTLATPYICRPIEHGANIVIHSTTKYSDGHATSVGGMVIEGGNFDWEAGNKYPGLTTPDESYHGLIYTKKFGNQAFCVKLRAQMLRDLGTTMSPMNAFMTFEGLSTLPIRMERHSDNAIALAKFLESNDMVEWVNYPGLESSSDHKVAKKYFNYGYSGVMTFGVKGGKKAGEEFIKKLKLASLVVHVGDIRTSVLHPASTTHRQLSEAAQLEAGISPSLIRVSVGIEDIDDIIEDFANALSAIK